VVLMAKWPAISGQNWRGRGGRRTAAVGVHFREGRQEKNGLTLPKGVSSYIINYTLYVLLDYHPVKPRAAIALAI
jgi:hypothetical protein